MIDLLRGIAPRYLWGAVVLLVAGLSFTVFLSLSIKADVEAVARREFDSTCNEIQRKIVDRLAANALILRSGAALFDATETVSREEWRAFVRRLQDAQQTPAIQGIGYALVIPRERLAAHVRAIRREGFPDYQVTPAGERETYSSIIYLEPFSDRNLRAFGYDMLSEPVRRPAMERARDENTAALSGKVVLVQETGEDVQAGALMYVPVYRHGSPIDTVQQRRAALEGWVYSPYRMTDLMRATLRSWDAKQKGRMVLQIYDGDVVSADALLYDTQSAGRRPPASTALVTRLIPVDYAGRRWTLRVTQLAASVDYGGALLVLFGGTIISLLLFGLTLSLLSTRANARRMAERLTAELRESEEKHRLLIENSHDIIYTLSADEVFTFVSPAWTALLGHPLDQVVGQPFQHFVHPDDLAGCMVFLHAAIETGQRQEGVEYRVRRLDGSWSRHTSSAVPLKDEAGDVVGFQGTARDVTERRRAEEELQQRSQELAHMNEELVSETTALAEANAAITRIAATDHLTGLANRRHFYEALEKAVSLARRHGSPLALVALDLDGFKRANDSAGHEAGDEVLASFAALLDALCRVEDLPGRLGGDEFSLLLPGIDLGGARGLAERVLAAVRSREALARRGVTVSAGVAQWTPGEFPDDLLRRADEALYAAKRGGGDAVAGDHADD